MKANNQKMPSWFDWAILFCFGILFIVFSCNISNTKKDLDVINQQIVEQQIQIRELQRQDTLCASAMMGILDLVESKEK